MTLFKSSFLTFLAAVALSQAAAAEPKTLLLVGQGPDGHPRSTHEYMAGVERLAGLLSSDDRLVVKLAKADEPWPQGPALLDKADGAVLFLSEGAKWLVADPRRHEAFARLAARGGGLVALHWALGTRDAAGIAPFVKLLGGCHGGPDRKYQVVDTELRVVDPQHPITAGLKNFRVRDEFYYQLKFVEPADAVRPILQATIDGGPQTVAWAWERPDGGRSFGFTGLHFDENWSVPQYPRLITQAIRWTLKLPNE
jgi:Trehalose utilisation